jgi:inositol-phosphate phosphatase / L-galactose 1-phosphate phosphatase / histidinol-phosphatase
VSRVAVPPPAGFTSKGACPPEFIEFAGRLADAAGAVILPHFRQPLAVERKPDLSPVTVADRASEKAMRDMIEAQYPRHGILGEEFGSVRRDAEYVWILDPIDGTKSFIAGLPLFGTLIALAHQGQAIVGVIDQPFTRERWVGASGQPTRLNGRPVKVRACARLADATLMTTSVGLFKPAEAAAFENLRRQTAINRLAGDCYAYGLLAAGHADLVVECTVKPYDFAALVPVIAGAGGLITDWEGQPLSLAGDARVLAAGDKAAWTAALKVLGG